MKHVTPKFPQIAEAEGEITPFGPFTTFPNSAMYDSHLSAADHKILAVIIDDCNGMIHGRPGRKRESDLTNKQIAERSGVKLRTVVKGLNKLDGLGLTLRFRDEKARGTPRLIQLMFRTSNGQKRTEEKSSLPRDQTCASKRTPGLCVETKRAPPPSYVAPANENVFEKELKTSEDATCVRTIEDVTADQPPAEAITPAPVDEPPAPSLRETFASLGVFIRPRHPAAARVTPSVSAPATPAPAACPPVKPPSLPATPPPPRPTGNPTSSAFDGAWAKLMASAKVDVRSSPPVPPGARTPAPIRPGVGPATGVNPVDLARSLETGGERAVAELVAELARRWRDPKPETAAFWASGLAEVTAGVLTADLVAGLVKDADRKEVKQKARQFSRALGQALADARTARKNRPPGPSRNTPDGRPESPRRDATHYIVNGSPRK